MTKNGEFVRQSSNLNIKFYYHMGESSEEVLNLTHEYQYEYQYPNMNIYACVVHNMLLR
jgi:hypothetical protein